MSERPEKHILPRDKGAAPLDFVIGVMAFLAALALGASLVADRAATGWQTGLAGRLTIQILPPDTGAVNEVLGNEADAALKLLRATPGIARASALSDKEIGDLVAPWIGKQGPVAELPLPKLIDAVIVPGTAIDIPALRVQLKSAAPHALLDDHGSWLARLGTLARSVRFVAYGILLLIAGATAATVSFATRAGLEAHHEMVSLLHQMGALSSFIARAVERHYFLSALFASLLGTALAAALFLAAGSLEFVGVEAVPFLPPLGLRLDELPWLLGVPAGSAIIAWITARLSVLAVVRDIY